jgi:hypothetical protein
MKNIVSCYVEENGKAVSVGIAPPLLTAITVINTYNDMHGNWWREWSDGWLEQGGLQRATANYAGVKVDFLRPFSGPDYTLVISALINEEWFTSIENVDMRTCSDVSGMCSKKTASSFYVQGFSSHMWYACGIKGD